MGCLLLAAGLLIVLYSIRFLRALLRGVVGTWVLHTRSGGRERVSVVLTSHFAPPRCVTLNNYFEITNGGSTTVAAATALHWLLPSSLLHP
uniref:Putative secreted protein n=1 Tax=Anopheles marajoara TaxID=58244 RepID=A0A2M4C9S3_9DIPT